MSTESDTFWSFNITVPTGNRTLKGTRFSGPDCQVGIITGFVECLGLIFTPFSPCQHGLEI